MSLIRTICHLSGPKAGDISLLLRSLLPILFLLTVLTGDASALLADRIQARLDLTAVQSETGALRNENVRQEYGANWNRQLLPYVNLRASFNYFKYDVIQEEVQSLWSKEMSPRTEISWSHPLFNLSASASRRDSWAIGGLGVLRNDSWNVSFRTRNPSYPVATLHYDWLRNFETGSGSPRDTRDRRMQAGISYTHGGSSLGYTQTRRLSENLLPGLETEQLDHMVRWSSSLSGLEGGRVQLATFYTFIRNERVDRVSGGELLESISVGTALYAFDTAPEFGSLDELPALSDGNVETPVDPPVDLGGNQEFHNLGADLIFSRPVSSIFVYTDRASSSFITWEVYSSEDNLDWTAQPTGLNSTFNTSLNRYEISFDSFEARYVKVVNRGLNEVAEVLVTEIEFYQAIQSGDREVTRDKQLIQLRLGVQFHERFFAALDLSLQQEPSSGLVDERINRGYTVSARYKMTRWLTHQARWEQSIQDFRTEGADLLDNLASYSIVADPLETLNATFTLMKRENWQQASLDQEALSGLFSLRGQPAWGLELTSSLLRSQTVQHLENREYATWAFRNTLGGAATRRFDFLFAYSLRDTRTVADDYHYRQHVWGVEGRYQITQTLFGSARFNYITERDNYMSQDYAMNWRPVPTLTFTGSASLTDSDGGLDSRRYSFGSNFDLNRRTALYLRLAITDLSQAGGSKTTSFQQGFRMRF